MDARDLRLLNDYRISAVVDLAVNERPAQLAREMIYCRFPLVDGDGNSQSTIDAAIRCVVSLVDNHIRTLVACSAGMSRSPALAAAAIAVCTGCSPDECLITITRNAPHDVSPMLWSRIKSAYNAIVSGGHDKNKPDVVGG